MSDLYEAVFGAQPTSTSQMTMRRLQQFLKLKTGDPYSRMLIVQLRSADQMEETRLQLQTALEKLAPMLATASKLTFELERATGVVARENRRIPHMERSADLVDEGRSFFPLFSYLACGFRPRSRDDDLQVIERRSAARYDLFLLICLLGLAAMAGAAVVKFGAVPPL